MAGVQIGKEEAPKENNTFILPDGTKLELSQQIIHSGDVLFKPDLFGLESEGISSLVTNSIKKCESELR